MGQGVIEYWSHEWEESVNGDHLQQRYTVKQEDTNRGDFLIRRYGDYEWTAINLSLQKCMAGMILAQGQSDTDVFSKVTEICNLWYQ